ncbi:dipeptide ABC transporter ATP-binding protein [Chitinibacter sp. SCUT-21]|uniref:ABC transporter ATP-binding protein n=1 Tax=Chitinibacter sp. SCUT-21 TaxID=2970891 RepID=UPI0035A63F37
MSGPVLEIQDLSIGFTHGSAVVQHIDLHLNRGEKLALVGESGSGKSVLARAILRLDSAATLEGHIFFHGADLLTCSASELRLMRGAKIAMIFQEPMVALNPLQTVGQQIAEVLFLHLGYSPSQQVKRVLELLHQVGMSDPDRQKHRYPHQLSGGQRQRVMIAMALAAEPELLIADEPTTALDVTIQAQILALLAQIQAERKMTVLLITHDLNLVRHFADRVAVMQQGRIVETAATADLFSAPQHSYTQQLLAARPQRVAADVPHEAQICLQAQQISHQYAQAGRYFWQKQWQTVLAPLDFNLRQAETLAIVGESGSGKTTLILAILRLLQSGRGGGRVDLSGKDFTALQGAGLQRARRDIQIVFQDPFAALSPRMTVEEIVGEGLLVHELAQSPSVRRALVVQALLQVGLTESMLLRYPHEFSGGQRQRIAIARALVVQPKILVLDEPTSALDATIQQQILSLLATLQRQLGLSYVLVSHDMAVVRALAHRVLVLKDGQLQESASVEALFTQPQSEYTQALIAAATLTLPN